ncbi:methyltransferase [Ferrimonas marina]|uniref:Methyltransferase domain-containing protein n=1 Tax=Ferrimonas marina TaxID=299255 RepID=A0A1M5NBC7_9GAMM|nr:methyltransferase [Ferrimonas marina]SHG86785.1 Methyltransferase domain-containing protein [Ferrimonas marina]
MNHDQALTAVTQQLIQWQAVWRANPYQDLFPRWLQQHPELEQALMALCHRDVQVLEQDEAALAHWLQQQGGLKGLPALPKVAISEPVLDYRPNPRQFAHIPGRKWTQILGFSAHIPSLNLPFVEWCAGKGHLGRLLSLAQQQPVLSLEYDAPLVAAGNQLAQRAGAQQQCVQQDVLDPACQQHLKQQQHAVALHACGDLHVQLMRLASAKKTQAISLSPCCYHLTADEHYQPLSAQAQTQPLLLSRQELRLAVLETATAPRRVRRLRSREMSYRLACRWLYQQLLGQPAPNLSSVPKQRLGHGFADFARFAFGQWQQPLAGDAPLAEALVQGRQQWRRLRRLELLRQTFRPYLERYLVLDRIRYLEEQGYRVELTRFAQREVTPRSYLIQAQWQESQPSTPSMV